MDETLNTNLQHWRTADAAARLEERRLFYAAMDSVNGGNAPTDLEWVACGQLRALADKLFYLATHSARLISSSTPASAPSAKRQVFG